MAVRCSKHPMMWEPCSICKEIENYKLLVKSAESEMKETEYWNEKLGEEINDVRRVMNHAEESAKKYAEQTCELQAEVNQLKADYKLSDESNEEHQNKICELKEVVEKLQQTIKNNSHYTKANEILLEEKESEIEELSTDLEKALNNANKSYDPVAKLKLSVNDLLVVRGIFVANSFLFNSLHNIDDCIANKKDEVTKQQLTLIKKDLEKEWQRVVDLLKVFAKEFSDSNWNRMIRETQKIVELSVETMNSRELGHWTVGKNDELDIDYKIRPLVTKAIETCVHSAGSNQLTAYSREELVKSIVKICEEK